MSETPESIRFKRGFRTVKMTQSVPDQTYTKIQFNSEDYDLQNEFDSVTNFDFRPQKAGYYFLTAGARFEGVADAKRAIIDIFKNGVALDPDVGRVSSSGTGQWIGACVSDLLYLVPGDYIDVRVWHNHGAAVNVSGYFGGFLIH